jgi:hypothetical protein
MENTQPRSNQRSERDYAAGEACRQVMRAERRRRITCFAPYRGCFRGDAFSLCQRRTAVTAQAVKIEI